jgi:hypothetical protein
MEMRKIVDIKETMRRAEGYLQQQTDLLMQFCSVDSESKYEEGNRKTVDIAVAALQPLLGSGGFIPCPRGELPPETKWELVQYYTEQIKKCS